jgi:hypothetical protein
LTKTATGKVLKKELRAKYGGAGRPKEMGWT